MVRVPRRMLLDLMLKQLDVPEADYRLEEYEDGTVRMTMFFNVTALALNGVDPLFTSQSGFPSKHYEVAEDTACVYVITYTRMATNMVIAS